jgi:hypothetical protein
MDRDYKLDGAVLDVQSEAGNRLALAFSHGHVRCTIVNENNQQITLDFKCLKFGSQSIQKWADADICFISQPRSGDRVAMLTTPWTSAEAIPPSTFRTNQRSDPGRVMAAEMVLNLITGAYTALEVGRGRDRNLSFRAFDRDYWLVMGIECLRCGEPLDREESIALGFGPDCAEVHAGAARHRGGRQGPGRRRRRRASRRQPPCAGQGQAPAGKARRGDPAAAEAGRWPRERLPDVQ